MLSKPLVVETLGQGQTLSLVHGWAMHSGLFEPLISTLGNTQVQRIDLPGHGLNRELEWPESKPVLIDALAQETEGSVLAGWSLGGLLSLHVALEHPRRLTGLVLISASPCFGQVPHWPHGVPEPLIKQLAHELETGPEQVLNRFLALEVHGSKNAAADLKVLRKLAFRHGLPAPKALAAGLELLRSSDLSSRLEDIDIPTLLIGGRRDKLVSFEALEATAERLPNARLLRIAGAAHAPFLTDPTTVARGIEEFMQDVAS